MAILKDIDNESLKKIVDSTQQLIIEKDIVNSFSTWFPKNHKNIEPLVTFYKNHKENLKNTIENEYKIHIELKEYFKKSVKEENFSISLCNWIVRDWGGIRAFDASNHTDFIELLQNCKRTDFELNEEIIKKYSAKQWLSSFSKILSFYDPAKFVIIDARTIHAINDIMRNADVNYRFRMVYTQIKFLNNYNDEKLNKTNYNIFTGDKEYIIFNELIRYLNKMIRPEKTCKEKPYLLEMELFEYSKNLQNKRSNRECQRKKGSKQ